MRKLVVNIPPEAQNIAHRCVTLFKHRLWMESYGNGTACMTEDECMIFTRNDGLPNNNILCFCEDSQGDIWMSTSHGISKLRFSDTTLTNYFSSDGALGDQYFEKSPDCDIPTDAFSSPATTDLPPSTPSRSSPTNMRPGSASKT